MAPILGMGLCPWGPACSFLPFLALVVGEHMGLLQSWRRNNLHRPRIEGEPHSSLNPELPQSLQARQVPVTSCQHPPSHAHVPPQPTTLDGMSMCCPAGSKQPGCSSPPLSQHRHVADTSPPTSSLHPAGGWSW